MADSEFEEFRRVFDKQPQHIKAPTPFYSLAHGAAASKAENSKRNKYSYTCDISYEFVPYGEETMWPWGPEARALFRSPPRSGDKRAGDYLGQRISLDSLLGTLPQVLNSIFYLLVPNVGLEDESPSSKSDDSPEEDRRCAVDVETAGETVCGDRGDDSPSSVQPQNHFDPQRSPRHQHFSNGERRRRKLPEIPKNRKPSVLPCLQPVSLADELGSLSGVVGRQGGQGRPLLVLKCGYILDEDSSPDSERLQSLGDVDSGHSTAHSPIDAGPKSLSPTLHQPNVVSPSSSCSIGGVNFSGNVTTVPQSQLEMLEATHRGLHKFNPRHQDEIEVEIGDAIYVQKEADDLWCEGVNLRTGQQGVFPSAYAVDMDYNDFDPANAKVKRERYLLGYMGSVETVAHKGTAVVCQAVKKIAGDCTGEPSAKSCILEVSDRGLRMVDRSKPNRTSSGPCIDYFYSLKNVSFCAFHPRDHRYLGFITKHPTLQRFACHVFRGQESTRPVAEAVGRAFQRFYQKFIETAYPIEDIYIE